MQVWLADCRVVVGSRLDVSRSSRVSGITSAIITLSLHTTLPLDNFTLHLFFSDTKQPVDNSSSDHNNNFNSFLNDTSDFVEKSSEFVSHAFNDSFKYSSIRFLFTSSHKTDSYWQMFQVSKDSIDQTTRRLPMVLYLSRFHKTILVLTPGSTGLRVSDVDGDVCWSLALGLPGHHFSTVHWWLECPARSYIVLHTCLPAAVISSSTCNPNQDCGCLAASDHSLSGSDHICSHFIWAWSIAGILAVLVVIVCADRCRIRDPNVAATKRENVAYSPQYLYNNPPESQLAAANTNLSRSTDDDMHWF
ncbi:uncharacterized protein [Procambarus clarkii]|uniref:uncharacterized protein n=1 Tax=Procambarus clarkii TaxID=6728 RepID=UPI0037435D46